MTRPETGDAVTDETQRIRTMFLTYEADEPTADTFMIVLGSIAENFRGVRVVEYQDDTVFADGEDAMTALHQMATGEERLTEDQQRQLNEFIQALGRWDEESP